MNWLKKYIQALVKKLRDKYFKKPVIVPSPPVETPPPVVVPPVTEPPKPQPEPTPVVPPVGEQPHPIDIPMQGQPPAPVPPPEPTPAPVVGPVAGYPPTTIKMCTFTDQYGVTPVGGTWNTYPPQCQPNEIGCFIVPEDKNLLYLTKNQAETNDQYRQGFVLSLVPGDLEWYKQFGEQAGWVGYLTSDAQILTNVNAYRIPGQPLYVNWFCVDGPNMGLVARN